MFSNRILGLRKTLAFRLTIWYAGIFTLSSFLAFSIFYYRIYSVTMARLDMELIEEIEEISEELRQNGFGQVRAKVAEEGEEEDEKLFFIRVLSIDGEVIASTDMASWGNINMDFNRLKTHGNRTHYAVDTVSVRGHEHHARVITAMIGSKEIMQIGVILEAEEEYLTLFRNLFVFLFLTLSAFSGLIGWFIARKGLRDVAEVTRTAMEISTGSPEQRVQVTEKYAEIERLGNAFNTMLDRIQTIHKAIREINDNIAHDLRSPLARIRGIAEMTLLEERSIDDFKDMAASTIEESDNLIEMINTMLEITETEAGVVKNKIEEFDLINLISEACNIFGPMAENKNIRIRIDGPNTLIFRADIRKLQRILSNILENAIKYTPKGGAVDISVLQSDGKVEVVIADTGIGISDDDLPRIFERFYRGRRSRASGGNGLGLSLARAFAASLGGIITAKSTLGKGSSFTVTFAGQH